MKYFLIGALANTLLLVGVVLLFGLAGSTDLRGAGRSALAGAAATRSALPTLALTLVVDRLGFELGAVPAHAWMPDVAQGAPAPAAAFLTVVPKIGAVVALARLRRPVRRQRRVAWPLLIAVLAVATMTLGNLAALWQTDLRRLLGWSSVSQAGYALMAVAVLGAHAPTRCRRCWSSSPATRRPTCWPSRSSRTCAAAPRSTTTAASARARPLLAAG